MKINYSLDEVALTPKITSEVKSRKDVNPFDQNGKLPLFVAPMTAILNNVNYSYFDEYVYPVYPVWHKEESKKLTNGWKAITLEQFSDLAQQKLKEPEKFEFKYCVDVANGHMQMLYDLVPLFKSNYPNAKIMLGNIGNPLTYLECCKVGVDYVRVGIGGSSVCTTSVFTGMHGGLFCMLTDIAKLKENIHAFAKDKMRPLSLQSALEAGRFKCITKVVADGGVDTIAKIIKCLALGADYVMCGKLFAECDESACHQEKSVYYGQSSVPGQVDRKGTCDKHVEGCAYRLSDNRPLVEFLDEVEASLRSAMSYAGAFKLEDFIGKCGYQVQTKAEFDSYSK
jgi:hypothetical protein